MGLVFVCVSKRKIRKVLSALRVGVSYVAHFIISFLEYNLLTKIVRKDI